MSSEISKNQTAFLARTYYLSWLLNSLWKDEWSELQNVNVDVSPLLDKELAINSISKLEKSYTSSKIRLAKKRINQVCEDSISVHLATRPLQSEIEEFRSISKKVLERSEAVSIDMYPNQTKKHLNFLTL